MSRTRKSLLLLPLFILLCIAPDPASPQWPVRRVDFYGIVQTIQDILAGKNREQAMDVIATSADLVYGTKLLNLKSVVGGEVKSCTLVDTSYHGVMIKGQTDPSETMGYILLKTAKRDTAKVRYHSVVFVKDTAGQYKIIGWHTGDR